MILFVTTLCVFGFVIFIMAIGVIVGGRQIKGSCGGPGGCEICFFKGGRKGECDLPCEDARANTEECGLIDRCAPRSGANDAGGAWTAGWGRHSRCCDRGARPR